MPLSITSTKYGRLVQHLHISAMKAGSSKITKGRLPPETLELIRQLRIAAVMVKAAEARRELRKVLLTPTVASPISNPR
uniref:Transposase n=1 Tax=Angiostrongylus cantonensis TaxID=6313 RepID=A0A0K0CZ85_ANGCA